MAIDEALLTSVGDGLSPSTLRFYTWRSSWISLGSAQRGDDLDRDVLTELRWGVVRRPSGGTAVAHQGQLGYATVLAANHQMWQGDLVHSYQRMSEPLAAAFAALGVALDAAPPGANAEFVRGAPALAARVCFAALGPYELQRSGRKIVGNAQVRRKSAALQHGVIQLRDCQIDVIHVLANAGDDEKSNLADYLATRVGSLEEETGRAMSADEVAGAIVSAFERSLGLRLVDGDLTEFEARGAHELSETKYANASWTFRR